ASNRSIDRDGHLGVFGRFELTAQRNLGREVLPAIAHHAGRLCHPDGAVERVHEVSAAGAVDLHSACVVLRSAETGPAEADGDGESVRAKRVNHENCCADACGAEITRELEAYAR